MKSIIVSIFSVMFLMVTASFAVDVDVGEEVEIETTWTPTSEGTYTVGFWVMDENGILESIDIIGSYVVEDGGGGSVTEYGGYWSFNETSGLTVIDSSGAGNDGTIYGADRVSGACGDALEFDGVDDYVEIPDDDSLDMPDAVTISAWVNVDELPSQALEGIVVKYSNGGIFINPRGKIMGWCTNDAGIGTYRYTETLLSLDTWYHVAMTCEANGVMKLYVDGEMEGGTNPPLNGNILTNDYPLQIGSDQRNLQRWFKGKVDEVRVYDRALSESEIEDDMECDPQSPFE